ncbi:hypothetical protein K1719_027669 [Acacia pycnantha]|nr:hypothetical protein K1719_027669 [Acacia pycnantha]
MDGSMDGGNVEEGKLNTREPKDFNNVDIEGTAIVSGGKGTAQEKIKTLREAGVTVVESPAKIGAAMLDIFKQRGLVE